MSALFGHTPKVIDCLFSSPWQVLQDRNVELALGYRVTAIKEAPGRPAGSTRAVLEVENVATGGGKPTEMEADLVLWTVRSSRS